MSASNPKASTHPKRWETAIIIWIGIYPTITLVLATLGSYILYQFQR